MTGESYRLPESMGGHECDLHGEFDSDPEVFTSLDGTRRYDGWCAVEYRIDETVLYTSLPFSWLTPVKPALPPEPPDRTVALVTGRSDAGGYRCVFELDRNWAERDPPADLPWFGMDKSRHDWAGLHRLGNVTLLVPDRLALEENLSNEDLDIACCIDYFEEHGAPVSAAAIRRLLAQRDELLAADPLAGEPVPLPATITSAIGGKAIAHTLTVGSPDGRGTVELRIACPCSNDGGSVLLTASGLREFARAMWAAANQTDKAQT